MEKSVILAQYMPPEAAPVIAKWIDYFQCEFKISKSRATKLGDYRHPFKQLGHKISVNNNLNSYAFLVTTVHEFAHLLTWNDHKNKVKPHGEEWKRNFKRMMTPFLEQQVFPQELQAVIITYLNNPSASSCTDLRLSRALKQYDVSPDHSRLEELPRNTVFTIKDGRRFKKGEHLFRYLDAPVMRCASLDTAIPMNKILEDQFLAKSRLHETVQKLLAY